MSVEDYNTGKTLGDLAGPPRSAAMLAGQMDRAREAGLLDEARAAAQGGGGAGAARFDLVAGAGAILLALGAGGIGLGLLAQPVAYVLIAGGALALGLVALQLLLAAAGGAAGAVAGNRSLRRFGLFVVLPGVIGFGLALLHPYSLQGLPAWCLGLWAGALAGIGHLRPALRPASWALAALPFGWMIVATYVPGFLYPIPRAILSLVVAALAAALAFALRRR